MGNPIDKVKNKRVLDALTSEDRGLRKEAQEIASDYLRTKAREDILMYSVLPPDNIGEEDLDPQVSVEGPTKTFEIEPDTPSCSTVPFGTDSEALEITGNRGLVKFNPVVSPRLRKDKFLLMGYDHDIRKILTDNLNYEIGEEVDTSFFALVDEKLGGSADTSLSEAGDVALWQTISGGLTPETWSNMLKILPKSDSRFRASTVVMNQVLAMDLLSWDSDQLSPSLLQELNERGWVKDEFKGVNLVITIKNNIIDNDEIYMFAEPNKIGRNFILDDITMYPDADGRMLEWKCEMVIGASIQSIGCAKVTLQGV